MRILTDLQKCNILLHGIRVNNFQIHFKGQVIEAKFLQLVEDDLVILIVVKDSFINILEIKE